MALTNIRHHLTHTSYFIIRNFWKILIILIKEPVVVNYSSDNNLKSLSIDGFELSPEFSKSSLEYKARETDEKVKAAEEKIRKQNDKLDEEIEKYLRTFSSSPDNVIEYSKKLARYFFELGLKVAQKGE